MYSKWVAFIATSIGADKRPQTTFYDVKEGVLRQPRQTRAVVAALRNACSMNSPERQGFVREAYGHSGLSMLGQHRQPAIPLSATRALWPALPTTSAENLWLATNRTRNVVVREHKLFFETFDDAGNVVPWVVEGAAFDPQRILLMQRFSAEVMPLLQGLQANSDRVVTDKLGTPLPPSESQYVTHPHPGLPKDLQRAAIVFIKTILIELWGDSLTPKQIEDILQKFLPLFKLFFA
jgi:hypothetical protein